MNAQTLPIPGIVLGAYPERSRSDESPTRSRLPLAPRLVHADETVRRYRPFLELVAAAEGDCGELEDSTFRERLFRVRAAMAREGLTDPLIATVFVLIRRVCAHELGLQLFDSQLLAARIMLDRELVEMATGEGKTLAAALCAATAALAGIPVHVITANDYLVTRDCAFLQPLYRALGLRSGAVTQPLGAEERRAAYDCDIVYCTGNELVFDYLRDGLVRDRSTTLLQQRIAGLTGKTGPGRTTLLRGLCMAIVDEADSILIDDARVPLILSERRSNEGEQRFLETALELAARFTPDEHFVLHHRHMAAELTPAGREAVERAGQGAPWRNRLHREEILCTALAALHLYQRDRHYLVRGGTVSIIDESTGRVAPGRVWSRGLHRLIELKERCAPGGDTHALAQITYQRFFQRYLALAGMSGTLAEARAELMSVYGLRVSAVPLARPHRRTILPLRLFASCDQQWQAAVEEAARVSRAGRPVLIGTDSVADSEALSLRLTRAGLPHSLLNARQDAEEARIIAEAGAAGRITVATNMAGRGTDIAISTHVAALGGLHVICCQHNASRRIDRQLLGRCARRGEPGSAQRLLAIERRFAAGCLRRVLAHAAGASEIDKPQWVLKHLARLPQYLEEARQRAQRRALLERDCRAARGLLAE